ncbi:testis-specific gene 13 protein isoform X2 [Dipodomys merriami]|uniref:testis-specific gene 13 protein isoform X2 n=1 Tax=Dipodomys merriami TaxID=94247 RepID=UPI003855C31A
MSQKTHSKVQIATPKASETTPVKLWKQNTDDGDLVFDTVGPSKFTLANNRYYTVHPNLEICCQPKPTEKVCLPKMPQEKKTTFPLKRMDDSTLKKKQWFRFSTDKDFKSEGKYSEVYALKKQKKLYPKLVFAPGYGKDTKKGVVVSKQPESQEAPRSQDVWEPLTFSSLLEQKPTRDAPGESTFRYGRAQQWIIKKATVTKR